MVAALALPAAAPEAGDAAARGPGVAGGEDVAGWLVAGGGLLDPEALDALPAAGDAGDAAAALAGGAEAAAGAGTDWLTAFAGAWLPAPCAAGEGAAAVEGAGAGEGADAAGAVLGDGALDLFEDVAALSVERAALSAERAALSAERARSSCAGVGLA